MHCFQRVKLKTRENQCAPRSNQITSILFEFKVWLLDVFCGRRFVHVHGTNQDKIRKA